MAWLLLCVLLIALVPAAYMLMLTVLLWLAGGFRNVAAQRTATVVLVSAATGLIVGLVWCRTMVIP